MIYAQDGKVQIESIIRTINAFVGPVGIRKGGSTQTMAIPGKMRPKKGVKGNVDRNPSKGIGASHF